jgi:hypothetical protein
MLTFLYILTGLFVLLQIFDVMTTRTILHHGGSEVNPIMREIMDPAGSDWWLVKIILAGIAVGIIWWIVPVEIGVWLLLGIDLIYVWIVHNNWSIVRRRKWPLHF